MRLLSIFARAYPGRSAAMLACLLLAALVEGVGLSSMLPLLGIVTRSGAEDRAGTAAVLDSDGSMLERFVVQLLSRVGLDATIGSLLMVIVVGVFVRAALVLLAQKQVGYTVAHVATDLRLGFIRALLAARWTYYVEQPAGALANAFATEAARASEAYLYGATLAAFAIQSTLYLVIAAAVSWQATIGALMVGAFSMLLLSRLVRVTRKAGAKQTTLLKELLSRLTDVLYAVKPLKAMAREQLVGPLLEKETERLNRALRRQVLSREVLRALQEPLLVTAMAGGLYVALTMWAAPIDTVILLALLFARALSNLNRVQKQYQQMAGAESAYWSLTSTVDRLGNERETSTGRATPVLERGIGLDDVTFSYGDRTVLDHASISIPAGEVTALVGPSGGGKTSIADLIIGLVTPQGGAIRVDGTPLTEIDLNAWRQMVGYVPQEGFLLHESVFVNVSLGDPELTERDVEAALRSAGAWDFVEKLPEGVHTPLGERGARVSGGQRQRIALARALVHSPSVLILDEATAGLDKDSEAAVCDTVRRLRGEMTLIVISHQPAILATADHVYELDAGRLARALAH
ncbi:MAG: ABC transporter ATP-binding protein [Myxococcales bacterium]|jgi:ATP-binding cassette subfamily C protein|nr:MAG: ABC transporter ATP-binding protein [Myxococcales bacterium]